MAKPLTPREVEVLALLAKGSTIRKVANALEIAERCVREHVEMVIEKLAVEDSTQAIAVALRNGII